MTTMLNAALALASRGLAVFPVTPGEKKPPLIGAWEQHASKDADQVRRWWGQWPDANIGICCGLSDLVVVDVDMPDGPATWEALCKEHGIEAETVTVTTPSGGRHYYYHAPADAQLRNTARRLGPGLDTRAGAGYVIAPPSGNGHGAYSWGQASEIAPLPNVLQDLLQRPRRSASPAQQRPSGSQRDLSRYVQAALDRELEAMRLAGDGQRNEQLNRSAYALGQLVASPWAGLDRLTVERELTNAAIAAGLDRDPGCGLGGIEATIRSGLESGLANPRPEPEDRRTLAVAQQPDKLPRQAAGDDEQEAESPGPGRPRKPRLLTSDYITLFEQWGHELQLNQCNDDVEINGKPLDDVTESRIMAWVRDHGILHQVGVNVTHASEAITTAASNNAYHPVKQYLEGLTWDGNDHIGKVCHYMTERLGTQGRFAQWFGHWIVGAVAKVYEPWQNPMLVIDGPQEIGKSYFANWLCPLERNFYAGAIYPENKDCKLRQMDVWLWEVEELGATTRRQDVEALKAFQTMLVVRDRKPYGHRDIIKPAMTSFIGTINNDAGFLVDRTGNRRFLICSLDKIDWSYADDVDRDQLWAQARAIYLQGEAWKLTDADRQERDDINSEYMIDDPVEALLMESVKITGDPGDFATLPQLLALLRDKCTVSQRSQSMTIASVLKAQGAVKKRSMINGNQTTVYYGVRLGGVGP